MVITKLRLTLIILSGEHFLQIRVWISKGRRFMDILDIVHSAWPDWEIVRMLGRGSYGTVLQVRRTDIAGTSHAAIKVISIPAGAEELISLRAEGWSDAEIRNHLRKTAQDFAAEVRLMEAVKGHTNIVSIEDYKVVEHPEVLQWYILIRMELLTPLQMRIQAQPLSEAEVVKLGVDLCSALSVCRRHNIVHRDIKPENIFINSTGDFKLGDFGVARSMERLTTGFTRTGTYTYMAPELFNGTLASSKLNAVARVDIYSLGMVLYVLTNYNRIPFLPDGQMPSAQERADALALRMRGGKLPPPACASKQLAEVILKACAYRSEDRYQSAYEFRGALMDMRSRGPGGHGLTIAVAVGALILAGLITGMVLSIQNDDKSGGFGTTDPIQTVSDSADTGNSEDSSQIPFKPIPLILVRQPLDAAVLEGDDARFNVAATGTGLRFQWQCASVDSDAFEDTHMAGANSSTLNVSGDMDLSGMRCRCVVTDFTGASMVSEAATLTVVVPTPEPTTASDSSMALLEPLAPMSTPMPTPTSTPTPTPIPTPLSTPLPSPTLPPTYAKTPKEKSQPAAAPTPESVFPLTIEAARAQGQGAALAAGGRHSVGLKRDGTVVAVGENSNGQCDVSDWRDIIAVAAGFEYTTGLKDDGTVEAVGENSYGQCDISDWRDIVAVAPGIIHTVGLKDDGTVVAAGDNSFGQCDVSEWRDIVAIAADGYHTVGLKDDGTVVAAGDNSYDQCDVSDWQDIVAIASGETQTIGLKRDGTVVAVGFNGNGQCDVSDWRDIVAIATGGWHAVGLKSDGTVVAVGDDSDGRCNVSDWQDIVAIAASSCHTMGLRSDGTIVAIGDNGNGRCDISYWRNIGVPGTSEQAGNS